MGVAGIGVGYPVIPTILERVCFAVGTLDWNRSKLVIGVTAPNHGSATGGMTESFRIASQRDDASKCEYSSTWQCLRGALIIIFSARRRLSLPLSAQSVDWIDNAQLVPFLTRPTTSKTPRKARNRNQLLVDSSCPAAREERASSEGRRAELVQSAGRSAESVGAGL